MARKRIRDLTIWFLTLLPLRTRVWLLERWLRPLLWFMFHLESDVVTIAPVGPDFCRFRMSYAWQDAPHYVLGAYEPEIADVLRREIAPGSVCFDVGANVGYYAILMARLAGENGTVVAFEPVPLNFETLEQNIALNALKNVRLEPMAANLLEQKSAVCERLVSDHLSVQSEPWAPRDQPILRVLRQLRSRDSRTLPESRRSHD